MPVQGYPCLFVETAGSARSAVSPGREVDYHLLMNPFHVYAPGLEVVFASEPGFPVRTYQKPGSNLALLAVRVGISAVSPVGVLFDLDDSRL